MPELELKPSHELTKADFERYPMWVEYYEPSDIEELTKLGFDRDAVTRRLMTLDGPDSYSFPAPRHGVHLEFWNKNWSAAIMTPDGDRLVGYWNGQALGIFAGEASRPFVFNPNLPNDCVEMRRRLAKALGKSVGASFTVELIATGETFEFALPF